LIIAEISTGRSSVGDRHSPIAVGQTRINVRRRGSDQEGLILRTGVAILDRDAFARLEKRKENINVYVVVGQVADVDLRRRVLRRVVPQHMLRPRIAGG
jgi:hypothetical protein